MMTNTTPNQQQQQETSNSSRYLWDMEAHHLLSWFESFFFPTATHHHKNHEGMLSLFRNLCGALEATMAVPASAAAMAGKHNAYLLQDPFRIWFEVASEWEALAHPLPAKAGEKLSTLSLAGLINGLAGVGGGIVDARASPRLAPEEAQDALQNFGVSLGDLREIAMVLHQAIRTQRQLDQLHATPTQIQNMMAPNLESSQFERIRKRVRDTCATGEVGGSNNEADSTDRPVALAIAKTVLPEEERDYKCVVCDNMNQSLFVLDRKNGDMVCSCCGAVVCERIIHLGSAYRNFEGEADRNHHGTSYNPLYSGAFNTATCLSKGSPTGTGRGAMTGKGASALRKTHAYIELNLCHLGEDIRNLKSNTKKHETRVGYKDQQKKQAFQRMQHVGDALDLNLGVLELAKELFAKFRNHRQVLKDANGVIAACLCEAFDQLSQSGRSRLQQELERLQQQVASIQNGPPSTTCNRSSKPASRAMRRELLHTVHLAKDHGCGLGSTGTATSSSTKSPSSAAALEQKPVASWDINDARAWLLLASRAIAKHWQEHDNAAATATKSLDDLEGVMVEHTFLICEYLETNMDYFSQGGSSTTRVPLAAGKKMLLMNAKKLSSILGGDDHASTAKALHQKLRGVVNRQAVRKSQAARQKASQLRFQQIKRKHWVQVKKTKTASV